MKSTSFAQRFEIEGISEPQTRYETKLVAFGSGSFDFTNDLL